jgi:hypothetical protein
VSLGFTREDLQACDDALALARASGDQRMLAFQTAFLAYRRCFQSRYQEALRVAEQAFPMALEIGDGYLCLAIRCFETIGAILGGEWGLALQLVRDGVDLANKNGHRNAANFLRLLNAWLALEASAPEEAAAICDSVLAGEPNKQAQFMAALFRAGVLIRQKGFEETGLFDEARREALRLVRMTEDTGEKNWAALGRLMLSRIARASGESKTAENELATALRHCDDTRNPLAAWQVLREVVWLSGGQQTKYNRRVATIHARLTCSLPPGEPLRASLEALRRHQGAAAGF